MYHIKKTYAITGSATRVGLMTAWPALQTYKRGQVSKQSSSVLVFPMNITWYTTWHFV